METYITEEKFRVDGSNATMSAALIYFLWRDFEWGSNSSFSSHLN